MDLLVNKKQLIDTVATETAVSKDIATAVVNSVLEVIQDAVASGDKVNIHAFGSFELVHKPARVARNPRTGGPVDVPARWTPKFKPTSGFVGLCAEAQSGGAA